ncbi:MAG TPA: haloalkane dehalogenase, partial [bacterium]
PTYAFPNDIPIDGHPADMVAAVEAYDRALATARIPMLLLTFEPGAITTAPEIEWVRANWPTCTVQPLGPGIHFVQEDQPAAIGKAIAAWLRGLK